jgi:hypothetical protein
MKRFLLFFVCLGALLVVIPSALGDGTVGSWNGSDEGCCWGPGETPTYGQTILGDGRKIQSFTFYLNNASGTVFTPAIYTWTGSAAGSLVWQGGDQTVPSNGFIPVTAVVGGVTLNSGQEYVLLFTTLGHPGPDLSIFWGVVVGVDAYPNGDAVYQNGPSLTSSWDGNPWSSNMDFAFNADFGAGSGAHQSCWNDLGTDGCAQLARTSVCLGGKFTDIETRELSSPAYKDATDAVYVEGYGLTCALSNVANAGLDPASFHDAGYKVDNSGTRSPAIVSDADFGAVYEFYAENA